MEDVEKAGRILEVFNLRRH